MVSDKALISSLMSLMVLVLSLSTAVSVIYKLHICVTRVNMLASTIYAHVNVLKYATVYAHVNCSNLIKVAHWVGAQ